MTTEETIAELRRLLAKCEGSRGYERRCEAIRARIRELENV